MICATCKVELDSRATFCPTCGRAVDDPLIGYLIAERYEPQRRIAIGGFGSIYRALDVEADRQVALKIMHRELAADAKLVARFRREGEVLTKLRDPHTVATYAMGTTSHGLPFLVMELLDGEPMLRLFQLHGRMPWRRMLTIARGICSALAEAHALGIIHRDLKPANIFVTTDEQVKVLDFGIARIMANSDAPDPQELTVMGTAVGTVEYMAPEQLMGGKADARTDIYTVGVLAYEMITGRRPFNARGLDLLTIQLTEAPAPPSTAGFVPPEVDALLLRCLEQDPSDRFQNVHELAHAIDAVLAAHPAYPLAPAQPPQPVAVRAATPLPIEAPRSVTLILGVAMILLLTGIGLLVAYFE